MKFLLLSFKSRNNLYNFTKFLKLKGISFSTINTPRKISTSCGLSIKTSHFNFNVISNYLRNNPNTNIVGVFIVEQIGLQENIQRVL